MLRFVDPTFTPDTSAVFTLKTAISMKEYTLYHRWAVTQENVVLQDK